MTVLYGIYGAGGCGRGIMPLLARQAKPPSAELVFIDDSFAGDSVNGYAVRTWDAFVSLPAAEKAIAIAVADPRTRETLNKKREASGGIGLIDVIAENSVFMDDVEIGPGCLISPFATFTSNVRVGTNFHCNIASYVEHDCRIGDYVTFAPGVHCNGNIHIEDYVYVGSGAIIRQGTPGRPLRIGRGAVIGMGAVVTKDVEAGTTVVGNPARPLRRS